ncbi:MAG: hypothetical protein IIX69_05085 [Clostridia bacterium]|nr:hypothetical protein [Clostridia bacterium]MBR0326163.1 hypothetical protein [Clostridia bacterium]
MPQQSTTKASRGFLNSVYSLLAVFIAFMILAIIASGTIPTLRAAAKLPINEASIGYAYKDAKTLFADSFSHSLNRMGLLFAFMLCAFSLLGEAVISLLTAINGFCLGSALFCVLSSNGLGFRLGVYITFTVIAYLLSVLYAALCLQAHKSLFIIPIKHVSRTALVLFLLFLTFCGAYCLLRTIELLLL